jgi:hypothetical protein
MPHIRASACVSFNHFVGGGEQRVPVCVSEAARAGVEIDNKHELATSDAMVAITNREFI